MLDDFSIFSNHVATLLLSDKLVPRVVEYALGTDQLFTTIAEVSQDLFLVQTTHAVLAHLLLLPSYLQSDEVLW